MSEEVWDAICVGAGITSLAFGAQLARLHPGTRVLMIDRHTVAGGYATSFSRPKAGVYFDCSLHKLTGTSANGGNFHRMFHDLGLDAEVDLVHHHDHFEACLEDETLWLGGGGEAVERALCERFPDDAEGVAAFFEDVRTHGCDSYHQFQIFDGTYDPDFKRLRWAHRNLKAISVSQALSARVRDTWLREILAAQSLYVGGYPEELSYLYFLHMVYATVYMGNAYVRGSVQRLSDALAGRVRAAGGQIVLDTAVRRIVPAQAGGLHAVETSRGRYLAPKVFINAPPHHAMGLFDAHPELEPVNARLAELAPARATTTLYLVLDRDPAELGVTATEMMILTSTDEACLQARALAAAAPENEAVNEHAYWRSSPLEVTNYHALNPEAGRILCVNALDSIRHWPERRSKDYKLKKARAQAALLERVLRAKPVLAGHIVYAELSTPLTYRRFTNNTDGSGYGAAVGVAARSHGFHRQFPFQGIEFLSAWVAGTGYEATFGYAEMKARAWAG